MRRAFAILLAGVFVLSFFKGFRLPNLWSATHFTFNYSQGFVRRALIGELARQAGGDDVYRYGLFTALSLVLLGGVLLLFALAVRRALRAWPGDWTLRVALLVLCASPGLVFLVHLIGYFDYFGLLAVLGLSHWVSKPRNRYLVFALIPIVGAILALIHEGLVVMFGPTALFMAIAHWLRHQATRPVSRREGAELAALCAGTALLLAASVVAVTHASDTENWKELRSFAERHADFPTRSDAFEVLLTPLRENILEVVPGFWRIRTEQRRFFQGMIGFLPGFAFLLFCGVRQLRAREPTLPLRRSLVLCFLVAALAPELMNIAGWDWPRWNSMALMCCALCLLTYAALFPNAKRAAPSLPLVTTGLLLCAIGLASTTFLFDNLEVQFFPFERQGPVLKRLFRGHFIHPKP